MNRLLRLTIIPALFVMLVASPAAIAQIPRTISFQGVLADASGTLVADGVHRVTIRLYDGAGAASAIYAEVHDATVVRGVFNIIIGSQTPLPGSLAFDRAYFLGVSIGNGAELIPRTALTAVPYALRASIANELDQGAAVVRSINGRTGAITIQGGGATTVTQSGATITVSSSGGSGATGIQGVQNSDGTITVANPNGPVATLGLADSAITSRHLASRAVTTAHLADTAVGTSNVKDASITQSKLAPGVTMSPGGAAGGDLTGTYPSPSIRSLSVVTSKLADTSVTTAKLSNDAVTSAKIANGTIVGADISTAAALSVATLATTGNAAIGTGLGGARLLVHGSGITAASTALEVNDLTGAPLLRVRDNGFVGIGVTNPGARLDIAAGPGTAINMRSGTFVVSNAVVPGGAAIPLPPATSVQITDNGVPAPMVMTFPAAVAGQIMYVTNDDADAVVGPLPIASGQTRAFIYVGGLWRLIN